MKRIVFIRADASEKIGLGHVIRCFALAQMIKDAFEIRFFCKEIPTQLAEEISSAGFTIEIIEREDEFVSLLNTNSIVILDGYGFGLEYQAQIKKSRARIILISDFKARNPFADIILNQAPGIQASDYQTSFSSRFLLGADYALLRPIFFRTHLQEKIANSVFICFGGADPLNLSLKTLEVLSSFPKFDKCTIVTGAAYQFQSELEDFIHNSQQNIEYFHAVDAEKMHELMSQSELAIVPASSIIYEAMATNCQIISGYYVDNQKLFYEGLKAQGCFYDAGKFESENLKNALNSFFHKPEKKANLIDKKSPDRIKKAILQLAMSQDIRLENMQAEDVGLTYKWATNAEVRKYSFQQKPIKAGEHNAWFAKKNTDENVLYYKSFYKNEIIGSVRFDIATTEATISYLLDPKCHGKGLALPMLMAAIGKMEQSRSNVKRVVGYVMKENLASICIFEALGFVAVDQNDRFQFFK
ncbi:UDP-2,4-diacetamido-2,4,6-trideoxy-beta-L-altropyranose hydrolase [Peijinzhouia sedimentorum]